MIPEKSQTPLETPDIFNGNLQIIAKKSSASAPHTHRIQIGRLEAKGLRKARLFGMYALFPYLHSQYRIAKSICRYYSWWSSNKNYHSRSFLP